MRVVGYTSLEEFVGQSYRKYIVNQSSFFILFYLPVDGYTKIDGISKRLAENETVA